MNLEQYQSLIQKRDSLQRQQERSKGKLEQLLSQLQSEYGCGSIEEAEKELARLKKAEQKAEKEADAAYREWERKWGGKM